MVCTIMRTPPAIRGYWGVGSMAFVGKHRIAGEGGLVVRRIDEKGVTGIEGGEIVELAVEFFWDAVNRRMST